MQTAFNRAMENANENIDSEKDCPTYDEAFPALKPSFSVRSSTSRTTEYIEKTRQKTKMNSSLAQAKGLKGEDMRPARVPHPRKGSDVRQVSIARQQKSEATKANPKKGFDLDKVVEEELEVDRKHRTVFFQSRAQLLQKISRENGGVNISFPPPGSNSSKVLLKGARKFVSTAKIAITEVVKDRESQTTVECVIARRHHGKVIGVKGANVQALSKQYNVSIKFPDRAAKSAADVKTGTGNVDPLDVVVISGKKENCLRVKEALLNLTPGEIAVAVPFRFHRAIIGQRGENIRSLGDKYEVWIHLPPPELEEDYVYVQGLASNREGAKKALLDRVKELEDEENDRELRSHRETVQVSPKYHPSIIGPRGATITKIRTKYDVDIQLPHQESANNREIVVVGYEHQARAAIKEILQIVEELEKQVSQEVNIDYRLHARLIGAKGKNISKVMKQFKVVVHFPGGNKSNKVTISGREENVEDAKEHLLKLADDLKMDILECNEDKQLYGQASAASSIHDQDLSRGNPVVTFAPLKLADFLKVD